MESRVRLMVSGRVQGVFFRAATVHAARDLRLRGWVRNCPDGAVEIVAEGPLDGLHRLLEWAKGGPPQARVDEVRVTWGEVTDEFPSFEIR